MFTSAAIIVVIFVSTTFLLPETIWPGYYWIINASVFCLCGLVFLLGSERSITYDNSGFVISHKRFWESSGQGSVYEWSDITDTVFYGDGEEHYFAVEVDGMNIRLLEHTKFSIGEFDRFINIVNDATPHLPYIWEQQDGLVGKAFPGRRYSKVSRK